MLNNVNITYPLVTTYKKKKAALVKTKRGGKSVV